MPMTAVTLVELAGVVSKLKMYPYFDVANYILMCLMVREDGPQTPPDSHSLSRKHPLSCWLSSMLMCFASVIMTNVILGEPPITPFTNHRDVLTASIVWYAINYSPFDITYKLCKFLPVKVILYCLKEVQRASKVHHGVHFASKVYPDAYVIICAVGVLKGAGYYYIRIFERLVRGTWIPTSNEILNPTLATKASLIASILFILDGEGLLGISHHLLYLSIVAFFVLFRVAYLVIGIHNPFSIVENLVCTLFFGGLFDAIRRAVTATKPIAAAKVDGADQAGGSQAGSNSPAASAAGKASPNKAKEE